MGYHQLPAGRSAALLKYHPRTLRQHSHQPCSCALALIIDDEGAWHCLCKQARQACWCAVCCQNPFKAQACKLGAADKRPLQPADAAGAFSRQDGQVGSQLAARIKHEPRFSMSSVARQTGRLLNLLGDKAGCQLPSSFQLQAVAAVLGCAVAAVKAPQARARPCPRVDVSGFRVCG